MERSLVDDPTDAAPAPSLASSLFAPFRYFYSPVKAAQRVAEAPPACSEVLLAVGGILIGVTVLGVMIWEGTVVTTRDFSVQPGTMRTIVETYSFAEVWRQWHPDGGVTAAVLNVVAIAVLFGLLVALGTWLVFPTIYGGGPVRRALHRSFATVISGVGIFWLLAAVIASIIVAMSNYLAVSRASHIYYHEMIFVLIVLIGCSKQVIWLSKAAKAVAIPPDTAELPPRCEDCGYDLTAQPIEGRCPECGRNVADSLLPDRRPGAAWQKQQAMTAGLRSAFDAIRNPRRFYGSLRLRTSPDVAERFARPHFALIGTVAAIWIGVIVLQDRYILYPEFPLIPLIVGCVAGLLSWFLHRFVGAAVMSWWIVKNTLPRIDWARSIINYESSFLWVGTAYNILLVSTFFMYDMWISDLAQLLGFPRYLAFVPLEPLVWLGGNTLLIVMGLLRYRAAAEAVRWSNY